VETLQQTLRVGSDEIVVRASAAATGGALFVGEIRMAPGGGPPVLHRHAPGEIYYVLAGEFTFYIADEAGEIVRSTATAGAVVPLPGGRAHTIRNESDDEARALTVHAPGEAMERFAFAAADLAAQGSPSLEEVLALAERHGIEMLGPIPA
jgi:oxalate decarboxylase/phosphoglucose isomerase-like protein (cupin superfamily)